MSRLDSFVEPNIATNFESAACTLRLIAGTLSWYRNIQRKYT